MKKNKFAFIISTVCMLGILSACGQQTATPKAGNNDTAGAKPSYTFKLGHEVPITHIKHLTAEKFKEELATRSGGRMKVDIFPAAQLGKEKEIVQQVQTGTVDFAIISNGFMASQSESLNGWFLPFLFSDLKSATDARKSAGAQQMLKDLDSQGILGLDYLFAGNRHLLLKSGTVNNLDDIKGKKIRVPASPLFEEFWKSAGAGPTPIPLPEVYMALQTGVIDGVDIDIDALLTQKFYETVKNVTLTNHMTFPEIAIASKTGYNKLNQDDQKIVKDAMTAAVEWGIQEAIKVEQTKLDELRKNGVAITPFTNKAALQPIIDSMYKKYSEKNPVIKAFIEQNKK